MVAIRLSRRSPGTKCLELRQIVIRLVAGLSDFAAKRLHRTAQGFSPGLSVARKSALKVAAEAGL